VTSDRSLGEWRWFTLDESRHVLELSADLTPPGCAIELTIVVHAQGFYAEWRWSEDGRTIARATIGVA